MSGNSNDNSNNSEHETLNTVILEIQRELKENRISQDEFNKKVLTILENQEQALKSIQNELKENLECRDVEPVKVIIPENSLNNQSSNFSSSPSKFVVRNVFKEMTTVTDSTSDFEEYFGVHCCDKLSNGGSVDAAIELKIVHPAGKTFSKTIKFQFYSCSGSCISGFIDWKEMEKDYMVDDKLIVEAHVNIIKMKGVYKDDLRCFDDELMKELSDVVLIVKERKFFVLRKYLATHSTYFKALFLGNFNESKKTEVVLSGIDSKDFQNYLEVLYGDNAIDERTVEGILLVADMYDTDIITQKCEEFLVQKSDKELKKKLQMSVRYNLEGLKKECLSEIITMDDIRSVLPEDIKEMDPSIIAALFEKSLSFK